MESLSCLAITIVHDLFQQTTTGRGVSKSAFQSVCYNKFRNLHLQKFKAQPKPEKQAVKEKIIATLQKILDVLFLVCNREGGPYGDME